MADRYPNPLPLALTPTPLQPLQRLSRQIGVEVWMKRDDMTGCIATAGNKIRKLEYLLADALAKGADCVVTSGGPQSNHARATAALAVRLGLESVLVFAGKDPGTRKANLLINELLGARLIFSGAYSPADQSAALQQTYEQLQQAGRKPYLIPVGGSNGLGTLGYIDAYREYTEQARTLGLQFDWIFVTTGSGGTHAGLVLGQHLTAGANHQEQIVGISTWLDKQNSSRQVAVCIEQANELLTDRSDRPLAAQIQIDDRYLGSGYGIPTPACIEAIRLLAQTEGILLDQVYTGKTMAGLLDYVKKGIVRPADRVLFWHTGGGPGIFAREWVDKQK